MHLISQKRSTLTGMAAEKENGPSRENRVENNGNSSNEINDDMDAYLISSLFSNDNHHFAGKQFVIPSLSSAFGNEVGYSKDEEYVFENKRLNMVCRSQSVPSMKRIILPKLRKLSDSNITDSFKCIRRNVFEDSNEKFKSLLNKLCIYDEIDDDRNDNNENDTNWYEAKAYSSKESATSDTDSELQTTDYDYCYYLHRYDSDSLEYYASRPPKSKHWNECNEYNDDANVVTDPNADSYSIHEIAIEKEIDKKEIEKYLLQIHNMHIDIRKWKLPLDIGKPSAIGEMISSTSEMITKSMWDKSIPYLIKKGIYGNGSHVVRFKFDIPSPDDIRNPRHAVRDVKN